jgi:hypothetical protein
VERAKWGCVGCRNRRLSAERRERVKARRRTKKSPIKTPRTFIMTLRVKVTVEASAAVTGRLLTDDAVHVRDGAERVVLRFADVEAAMVAALAKEPTHSALRRRLLAQGWTVHDVSKKAEHFLCPIKTDNGGNLFVVLFANEDDGERYQERSRAVDLMATVDKIRTKGRKKRDAS